MEQKNLLKKDSAAIGGIGKRIPHLVNHFGKLVKNYRYSAISHLSKVEKQKKNKNKKKPAKNEKSMAN